MALNFLLNEMLRLVHSVLRIGIISVILLVSLNNLGGFFMTSNLLVQVTSDTIINTVGQTLMNFEITLFNSSSAKRFFFRSVDFNFFISLEGKQGFLRPSSSVLRVLPH